jgi:hypothetical protein
MTESEIRNIIRDELSNIFKIDRIVMDKNIQILNARNIQLGIETGTQIGTSASQKIAFWGATPIIQPAIVADPSGGGDAGVDTPARTAIIAVIDRLISLGLIASS